MADCNAGLSQGPCPEAVSAFGKAARQKRGDGAIIPRHFRALWSFRGDARKVAGNLRGLSGDDASQDDGLVSSCRESRSRSVAQTVDSNSAVEIGYRRLFQPCGGWQKFSFSPMPSLGRIRPRSQNSQLSKLSDFVGAKSMIHHQPSAWEPGHLPA